MVLILASASCIFRNNTSILFERASMAVDSWSTAVEADGAIALPAANPHDIDEHGISQPRRHEIDTTWRNFSPQIQQLWMKFFRVSLGVEALNTDCYGAG
jgi:hypothetical protein